MTKNTDTKWIIRRWPAGDFYAGQLGKKYEFTRVRSFALKVSYATAESLLPLIGGNLEIIPAEISR